MSLAWYQKRELAYVDVTRELQKENVELHVEVLDYRGSLELGKPLFDEEVAKVKRHIDAEAEW